MKLINEVLSGVRVIKMYAWERPYRAFLHDVRKEEIGLLRKIQYLYALWACIWSTSPFIVSLTTFAVYVLVGNDLTAEKAFVALSLFNLLQFPVSMFPMVIRCVCAECTPPSLPRVLIARHRIHDSAWP